MGEEDGILMDLIVPAVNIIVFALGASVGSFINVVVYRLPAGLSILWPPSRCPHCSHRLRKRENVPIWSWLSLRGRCSRCKGQIAVRYPVVEAATGLVFLLVFWRFGVSVETPAYWAFCSWLLALSIIDLDTMTLPNSLTQSGLMAGLGFRLAVGFLAQASWAGISGQLMAGILGATIGLWLFDVVALVGSIVFRQAAMGGGDARLAAMLGAWLGWKYLLLAGFIACAVGAFVGGGAIALGWLNRRQPMPFGPSLAVGAVIAVFEGEAILSTYIRLVFPTV